MINLCQSLFIQLSSCLTDGTNKMGEEMQIRKYKNTKSRNPNLKFWGKLAHRRLDKRGWRENANGSQKLGNSISIGIIPLQLFAKLAKSWNSTNYHSKRCFAESAISIYLKKIFVELILEICFCICTDLRLVLESEFQFIFPLLGERSLPGRWQGPSRIHNCTESLQKYKIHKNLQNLKI